MIGGASSEYGGYGYRAETYFINVKTNQITTGPSLETARYALGCAELEVSGKKFIVVTGGYGAGGKTNSTEILDKSNIGQGWQKGKTIQLLFQIFLFDIFKYFRK